MNCSEDALSAAISNETFRGLVACAGELSDPRLTAAMITGTIDGLARYVCAIQSTDTSPAEIAAAFSLHFERFVTNHQQTPKGNA